MDCETAQEILWPLDGPSEFHEDEEEARRHLRRCDACSAFFRRDARLDALLRRVRGQGRAPAELKSRILEALARETSSGSDELEVERLPDRARGAAGPGAPSGSPSATGAEASSAASSHAGERGTRPVGHPASWLRVAVAVLALGVGAAVAGLQNGGDGADPGPGSLFARDFAYHAMEVDLNARPDVLRHAAPGQYLRSSSPEAVVRFVRAWAGDEPVRVGLPGAELLGAMICWLKGRPAAVVMYRVAGHSVYHYRYRPEGAVPEPPHGGMGGGGGPLSDVHVVRWNRPGEAHALVSDLSASELRRLVRTAGVGAGNGRS